MTFAGEKLTNFKNFLNVSFVGKLKIHKTQQNSQNYLRFKTDLFSDVIWRLFNSLRCNNAEFLSHHEGQVRKISAVDANTQRVITALIQSQGNGAEIGDAWPEKEKTLFEFEKSCGSKLTKFFSISSRQGSNFKERIRQMIGNVEISAFTFLHLILKMKVSSTVRGGSQPALDLRVPLRAKNFSVRDLDSDT